MTPQEKSAPDVKSKVMDRVRLIGAALLVIAIGVSALLLADRYHVNPVWVMAVPVALMFVLAIAWGYRSKIKSSSACILFFVLWRLVHVAVFILVLYYLGFPYYVPFCILELWIGYTGAIWLFGPPTDARLR